MACIKATTADGSTGYYTENDLTMENPLENSEFSTFVFAPPRPTAYPIKSEKHTFLMQAEEGDFKSIFSRDASEHFGQQHEKDAYVMTSCSSSTSEISHHVLNSKTDEKINTETYSCKSEGNIRKENSMLSKFQVKSTKSDSQLFSSLNTAQTYSQSFAQSDGGDSSLEEIEFQENLINQGETDVNIEPNLADAEVLHHTIESQRSDVKHKKTTTHNVTSHGDDPPLMTSEQNASYRAASTASYMGSRPVQELQKAEIVHQDKQQQTEIGLRRSNDESKATQTQEGNTQTHLLELMSKGLGNFTEEMAALMIDRMRPEYEGLARTVGAEVKEATSLELHGLRTKVLKAESMLIELGKERDTIQKRLEKEKLKGMKETEAKVAQIKELEAELEKVKQTVKDKEKAAKRAEVKAKLEEQKRHKLEAEHEEKFKEMQKQVDHAKGDAAQQKALRRLSSLHQHEQRDTRNRLPNESARRKKDMFF